MFFFLKELSQNFRKIREEVKLLMEKNFSKVQKTLHIFANVFGFWLIAKEIKFATLGTDRGGKESPLEGKSLSSLGLLVEHLGLGTNKIKLLLSPTPSTQVFPFHPRPQPSRHPTESCFCSQGGIPG